MQWGVTRRLGMWHWHEGTWFPRSQWPPRGQGPAWTKPAPDHRRVMGALQLLGPRKGPCAQAPAVLRSETAAPAASSWMFKSNSEPRQRARLRPANHLCGSSTGTHPTRRDTTHTPKSGSASSVSWAALAQAGEQRRRCPASLGPSAGPLPGSRPGAGPPAPAAASPGADCPPALSREAPTPTPLPGELVSLMHK